jgi:hypothetical protein
VLFVAGAAGYASGLRVGERRFMLLEWERITELGRNVVVDCDDYEQHRLWVIILTAISAVWIVLLGCALSRRRRAKLLGATMASCPKRRSAL